MRLRLDHCGWIQALPDAIGSGLYKLTAAGQRVLGAWLKNLKEVTEVGQARSGKRLSPVQASVVNLLSTSPPDPREGRDGAAPPSRRARKR